MFDAKLEGASLFREVCKVLCTLLSLPIASGDEDEMLNEEQLAAKLRKFEAFCNQIELAQIFSQILKQLTERPSSLLREQPWYHQIQLDVVILLHSYFVSQMSSLHQVTENNRKLYCEKAKEFLLLAPQLLNQASDVDLRLKERTMVCLISLCENFEQLPEYGAEWFNFACSNECQLFNAYFKCMLPDDVQLQKLTELMDNDRLMAEERQEDILHLGVAILAAFTYLPLHVPTESEALKSKVCF